MSEARTVASIKKNNIETIVVRVVGRAEAALVDVRSFKPTPKSEGEPRPTVNGVCIHRSKLPELIRALQAAANPGA